MTRRLPTLNEQGFTLIETSIAAGLMIASSLFIAYQHNLIGSTIRRTDARIEMSEVRTSTEVALRNHVACRQTFGGMIPGIVTSTQKIVRADLVTAGVWNFVDLYRVESPLNLISRLRIKSIDLTGALGAGTVGHLTAVVTFRIPDERGNDETLARELPILVSTDGLGQIIDCKSYEPGTSLDGNSNLCGQSSVKCANDAQYCKGQVYTSPVDKCLCFGSATSGPNVFGHDCSPSPLPSPSPTPSGTPAPSPTPSGAPSPSPSSILDSGFLSNGDDSIDFDFKLKKDGKINYAVFDADQGDLTPVDVKMYASMTPTGHLKAVGFGLAASGVDTKVSAAALPDKAHYFVYFVAEDNGGHLDSTARAYKWVIPRKLSMQIVPTSIAAGPVRRYLVSFPPGYYDAAGPTPLLMELTGATEVFDSASNDESFFKDNAETSMYKSPVALSVQLGNMPFVTLSIQCNAHIDDCTSYSGAYVDWMMKIAKGSYHVDEHRQYLIGYSWGGNGVWKAIAKYGDKLAAAIPFMSGGWSSPAASKGAACTLAGQTGMGLLAIHNENDLVEPVTGPQNSIDAYNTCSGLVVPGKILRLPGDRWPALHDPAHLPLSSGDDTHHNAVSYSLPVNSLHYGPVIKYGVPALEPNVAAFLATEGAAHGKTLNSLYDWLLLFSK